MNLEHIPKTFWHSISLSIILVTVGFITITYKSENFTLKYADLEFQTNTAQQLVFDAKAALTAALADSEREREKLTAEKTALTAERERLGKALSDAETQIIKLVGANKNAPGFNIDGAALERFREELERAQSVKTDDTLFSLPPGRGPASESSVGSVKTHPQLNQVQQKIDQLSRLHNQLGK